MAVTTERGVTLQTQEGTATTALNPIQLSCTARVQPFSFTQGAAAGDANSTMGLCMLPPGRVKVLGIYLANSAFGASRVLDVGTEAYTSLAGATVAAAASTFWNDLDVAASGGRYVEFNQDYDSKAGVVLTSLVTGGTIPAAATLSGYVLYAA